MGISEHYITFDVARLGDRLPHDERLTILRFWLRCSRIDSSDLAFGIDVENTSKTEMRLDIYFRVSMHDNFTMMNQSFARLIKPGERRRESIQVAHAMKDFKRFLVTDIRIGPSAGGENATFSPNASIYDMFSMDQISRPLPLDLFAKALVILVCILIAVGLGFIFFL